MAKTVGVLLPGCGVHDGTETHQAVLTLYFLDQYGVGVQGLAPDIPQAQVINHLDGRESPGSRDVLVESARIAQG